AGRSCRATRRLGRDIAGAGGATCRGTGTVTRALRVVRDRLLAILALGTATARQRQRDEAHSDESARHGGSDAARSIPDTARGPPPACSARRPPTVRCSRTLSAHDVQPLAARAIAGRETQHLLAPAPDRIRAHGADQLGNVFTR